jgi:hypothetical protein
VADATNASQLWLLAGSAKHTPHRPAEPLLTTWVEFTNTCSDRLPGIYRCWAATNWYYSEGGMNLCVPRPTLPIYALE